MRIPKPYMEGLRKLAVEGRTLSGVVREALERYFGVGAEPSRQEGGRQEAAVPRKVAPERRESRSKAVEEALASTGVMFPKAKWRKR